MKNPIPIKSKWQDNIEEFAHQVLRGEISHAVICYRHINGDLSYRLFNEEHGTYLIGMLERVIMEIHRG